MQKEVKENHIKEAEMKIEASIGFRHVIDLLSSEQKLIVGHNCFLGRDFLDPFILLRLIDFCITYFASL